MMRMTRVTWLLLLAVPLHAAPDDVGEEAPPRSWDEVGKRYQTECPVPFFTLETPEKVSVGKDSWEIRGSDMVRQGGPWKGPFRIGVIGAVKEASKETRENLKKAAAFEKRGVNIVVANGDVSEGEFDLEDAFRMIGEEIKVPVFVHIGNSEGKGSFTRAYLKAQKEAPHLFNINWIRHVDFGGVHLFSIPGYFNLKFLHGKAGCHSNERDLSLLGRAIDKVPATDVVVLTAHSPPKSFGKGAIDLTYDAGNVGDPDLAELIENHNIPFGLFGHILEAGGRATTNIKTGTVVKFPMKKPVEKVYVNAGSISSQPWAMLDGKQSRGMAAVLTVANRKGTLEFITLRK